MNNQKTNVVDLILDGWLNSFKTIHTFQSEYAVKWIANLQNTIKPISNEQVEQLSFTWVSHLEEMNKLALEISISSSQILLDLYKQSQVQLETNAKAVLDQQQKDSSNVMKKIELQTKQRKGVPHELLPSV